MQAHPAMPFPYPQRDDNVCWTALLPHLVKPNLSKGLSLCGACGPTDTLELFLNKRERHSTVQHRRQSHRPQSALCDCGSHVPKCCSASCRQSHARQRCGPDSRRYWQPFAPRSVADWDFFCSCEASSLASQSDRHDSPLECRDNLNRLAH